MSRMKVPVAVSSIYSGLSSTKERTELLDQYKDWQQGRFAKAHYDYLVKEYEKCVKDYTEASWLTHFARKQFLADNRAKMQLLKQLMTTFNCEDV